MKLELNDTHYNLEKWKYGSNNVLFVTGLSGSGKTTLSNELQKETNCELIHLDDFRNNQNTSTIDIIEKFKRKYPETKYHFKDRWTNEKLFEKYFLLFLDFILDYARQDKSNLYIIEGLQLFLVPYKQRWFSNKPLIIKGTSVHDCYKRQIERGSKELNDINMLKEDKLKLLRFKENYLKISLNECINITNFMRRF